MKRQMNNVLLQRITLWPIATMTKNDVFEKVY